MHDLQSGTDSEPGNATTAPAQDAASAGDASVSVILPTFNRAGYIADALNSILNQSFPLCDIVVVDDGSQDATREVVAGFGPRVRYVRQRNSGKLKAIERGLDNVRGELVWIMDDDDLAAPDAVEALRRPFTADPGCVMSYGRMSRFDDGEEDPDRDEPVPYPANDSRPFFVQLMEDCFITGHPCVLTRRSALEALRPFRPSVIASVDYYLYLGVAASGTSVFVDRHVLRQRQHGGTRGPAAHRYSESARTQRWIAQDKTLIAPLLDTLPLGAYIHARHEPAYCSDRLADPRDQRRALLQKAVIAARKKLWHRALDAFRDAVAIAPDKPFGSAELHVVARTLGCRYGIGEVHDDPAIAVALRRACEAHPDGTSLLVALSRPLLHQIKIAWRERDPSRARGALKVWSHLMTFRANVVATNEILRRNIGRFRLSQEAATQ